MIGTVNNIISAKYFGFILAENGQEYFFHRSDTQTEEWNLMLSEFERLGKNTVQVVFEPLSTEKGPRARNVTLIPE